MTERRALWARRRPLLLGAATGATLLAVLLAAGAVFVVTFGLYDVSATVPHSPAIAWAIHATMRRSVQHAARDIRIPPRFTPEQIRRGFHEYEVHCVMCHGGPGVRRAYWVNGLIPTPPYLLDAARKWSPAELRYIVSNGVKMTAMPAWSMSRPDGDIWDVVAFLERLPDVTPQEYAKLRAEGTKMSPSRSRVIIGRGQ